jgi:hypothetical protein
VCACVCSGASDPQLAGNAAVSTALGQIADALANHAVKNLSSLDNVTVMIIRILIADPESEIPTSSRLEGWQWQEGSKKQYQAASSTPRSFGENDSVVNNKRNGPSSSNDSSGDIKSVPSGSGKGIASTAPLKLAGEDEGLDFLYTDPMFAPSPEKNGVETCFKRVPSLSSINSTATTATTASISSSDTKTTTKAADTKNGNSNSNNSKQGNNRNKGEEEDDLAFLLDDNNF